MTAGEVFWSNLSAQLSSPSDGQSIAALEVSFPGVDWQQLKATYGWPALQWQGWARGNVHVNSDQPKSLAFDARGVLEYWIDDTYHFGGDLFNFDRAPALLSLSPGLHRIDLRLVRDVRSMGAIDAPRIDIALRLSETSGLLQQIGSVLLSDFIGGSDGALASPYASVAVRNNHGADISVHGIRTDTDACSVKLLSDTDVRLTSGQTRPIGFVVTCGHLRHRTVDLELEYFVQGDEQERTLTLSATPSVHPEVGDKHKITFLHSSGIVSWAILRPPPNGTCGEISKFSLPVLLALHGAGVNADQVKDVFDPLPDLCAWFVFPQGGSSWAGDDWHQWGLADVEAAIASIPAWIERVGWTGSGVDIDRWLVIGHSNGGQGVWHILTHRPDKIIAAAALSAYSSIASYVPYTFWQSAEPANMAVMSAAMNSYRPDLLLENGKGIPLFIQHGSEDDNVPVYQSRMMHRLARELGLNSTYEEVSGRGHYWDGVFTTAGLGEFIRHHLKANELLKSREVVELQDTALVVATPGDIGSKNGVEILKLVESDRLGRVDITINRTTLVCNIRTTNVLTFLLSQQYDGCSELVVDEALMRGNPQPSGPRILRGHRGKWNVDLEQGSGVQRRSQLGAMDGILRTKGAFTIIYEGPGTKSTALQISRWLHQLFGADCEITDDPNLVSSSKGSIISVIVGSTLNVESTADNPLEITVGADSITFGTRSNMHTHSSPDGLAAILLRPLPHGRLELAIRATHEPLLRVAARLAPGVPGAGQPDLVVAGRSMLCKGIGGVTSMGFFDSDCEIGTTAHVGL